MLILRLFPVTSGITYSFTAPVSALHSNSHLLRPDKDESLPPYIVLATGNIAFSIDHSVDNDRLGALAATTIPARSVITQT
jgi:hypothetical protein